MANDAVFDGVYTAMHNSPYNEHKLVFQNFLQTPEGRLLKEAVADILGGQQKLEAILSKLPEMDFYIPDDAHRKSWEHKDHHIHVTALLDPDHAHEATLWHTTGDTTHLHESTHTMEEAHSLSHAVFVLHPAEPKILREQARARADAARAENKDKLLLTKIVNNTTDGLFGWGGDCEFYFSSNPSSHDGHGWQSTDIISVPSSKGDQPGIKEFESGLSLYPNSLDYNDYPVTVNLREVDAKVFGFDDINYEDIYGGFVAAPYYGKVYETDKYFDDGTPLAFFAVKFEAIEDK